MYTKQHQHHISKVCQMKEELRGIYVHLVVKSIAISMISVFVPIQLLQLGFTLPQTFLFLLVEWVCFGLLAPLFGMIISRVGIKEVVLLRTPILVVALVYLGAMNSNVSLQAYYLFPAVLLGISSCLYTLSISSLFTQVMSRRHEGAQTSKFIALPTLGTIFGPLAGGWVVMTFGYAMLYTIVSLVLVFSVVPIAFVEGNMDHPHFRLTNFRHYFRTHRKMFLMLNLYGLKGFIFFAVLPIALFLGRSDVVFLGTAMSAITLCNVFCAMKIGHSVDRLGKRTVLRIGVVATAVMLAVLGIAIHSTLLVYLAVIAATVKILVDVPFECIVNESAKESNSPLEFFAFKEFSLLFGRAMLFLGLMFLTNGIRTSFFIGSVSALPILFF